MVLPAQQIRRSRELAARLLNAQPGEIAFVGPTSLALSFVAAGLDLKRHDNILIYFDDYPANVYPWMAQAERGVKIRLLNARELGRIGPLDVLSEVDENTRLVALASCHFVSGYRTDLNAIGQALQQRDILFCVDAIQTLGAFPTTVEHIDFLAADAHKWLLGPCAAGIFFVRQSLQERLHPTVFGWHNVRCPNYVAQEEMKFRADARRYEAGTQNLLGLVGLNAALELVLEIGIENIACDLLRKRALLVPALKDKGYTVLNADSPPVNGSGIITFYRDGADMAPLYQKLEAANIITSLRSDRAGRNYLRLSPHFYNTDAELSRLLEML
jgi:selenocysteine lyase/cysteine desulfurase